MHTTASDGDLSPEQLILLALKRGLQVIAITDHDTTDGNRQAQQLAQGRLTVIPAIELGGEDKGSTPEAKGQPVDVLGFFIHPEAMEADAPFQDWLRDLREDRLHRGEQMVQRLQEIGVPITFERVVALADGAPIARPHIARALVELNYAESIKDAFNRYIDVDGPAYVARRRLEPEEAITRLHAVGACAVLAHPGRVKGYMDMIERLVPAGLDGVEVNHPDNSSDVRLNLRGAAKMHDLIMTGGSDFHRPYHDGTITLGSFNAPEGAVEALRTRAARYR